MAFRPRKVLKDIETAKTRLAALTTIDKAKNRVIDYGDTDKPLTKAELAAQIKAVEDDNAAYNQKLDEADALNNQVEAGLKATREMNAKVLSGAAAKFGRDSSEVEQIGGIRLSERKRPSRKPKAS